MKYNLFILFIFVLLTLVMTYPLFLDMHEAVHESGDSLFNLWTVLWDIKALLKNPVNIFNANIFYPYKYTLAYSEHLIGIAVLALPVYLFTKNPLFIYNFTLLLSFVLCGWGAYLLTYYLTKNKLSGIVAGIIFAFCPFRFDQLGHLHILTSQWIPFALLCLHKVVNDRLMPVIEDRLMPVIEDRLMLVIEDRPQPSWGMGFGFFFFLQFLSSGHNGMYLAIAVGIFLLYFRIFPWKALLIVGLLLIPFYYPYIYLAKELGFVRPAIAIESYSPQLGSYLAVAEGNRLYGRVFGKFFRPEAVMFPGFLALVLAFWGKFKRKQNKSILNNIINILIVLDILVIIVVAITGGFDLGKTILGIKLKISDFARPVFFLILLYVLKIIINRKNTKVLNRTPEKFYWILAITAFLLSFGPEIRAMDKEVMWGPYSLLYNFVPGFKGLRVSGRIYTIFILALAVLAGFGVKKINYLKWIIPFAVLVEYINVPIMLDCRIGTKPSAVYKWLAEQPGDFAIIELPMPDSTSMFRQEIKYLYWSIYHGKKLVNGYSGYWPPAYWPITEIMKNFPNEDAIEVLNHLGVKYVIMNDMVSKVQPCSLAHEQGTTSAISKDGWTIVTNYNSLDINKAIDNDLTTRWHSATPQKPGMYVELDLGKIQKVCGVSMYFDNSPFDYPRGLELEISNDGKHWQSVPLKLIYANYVKYLLKYPKDNRMRINFKPQDTKFIKLIQTGSHEEYFWSIYELETLKV